MQGFEKELSDNGGSSLTMRCDAQTRFKDIGLSDETALLAEESLRRKRLAGRGRRCQDFLFQLSKIPEC